ncbi:Protein of uncharacterised function (DUF2971) [Streptococcus pneumoniae]|nr:Protein of uncharacterised function (DUF2971) [Streptococcus pneumoniae]VLM12736.1 Protein of uncharacterised function (DUF2971) [Streptococcus pneumoniae]VLZ29946.1 Protein of uncharacterised function (DUF2971) [Streptococcus pneumoniae]VML23433.1 Protein of uncharacterised function (DUF2971) [Streptococcus pneumoniae]VNI40140.1 Protein of uncharacterised function (DUF2971) [Streptococcus pneumoniae]
MVEFRYFNKEYKNVADKTFSESIVFFKDNWDDYGYYITFHVYCYDKECGERYIGSYRIYESEIEQQENSDGIKSIFKLSKDDFDRNQKYSLACNLEFYQNLYKFCSEYYNDFLERNKDLTLIDLPEEIKENKGVKKALLRNDDITKSAEIINLNQRLKEIDENLNIGNFSEDDSVTTIFEKFIKDETFERYERLFNHIKLFNTWSKDYLTPILEKIIEKIKNSGNNQQVNEEQLKCFIEYLDKNTTNLVHNLVSDEEHIRKIKEAVKCIKDFLRIDLENFQKFSADYNLVHYTSLSTLDILVKKSQNTADDYSRLRLSNARQLNDPTEGTVFLKQVGFDLHTLLQLDYEPTNIFLSSMSKSSNENGLSDSLPMWKQYADNATGICLTYDRNYLKSLIKKKSDTDDNDSKVEFYRVCYTKELESDDNKVILDQIEIIKKELKKIYLKDSQSRILSEFDIVRYLFKESKYEYEQEYRLIKECNDDEIQIEKYGEMQVPRLFTYLSENLKYSKITLGPKCDDIDYVAPFIKYVDHNIEVTKSQIPYR